MGRNPVRRPPNATVFNISSGNGASNRARGKNEKAYMPLTTVIITIVAVGLLLWLVNRFIPMQEQVKSILNGLVVIVLILWIANLYGLFDHLRQFHVGR
jgi:hypothetical protein